MSKYDFKCQCGFETIKYIVPCDKFTEAFRCPYCQELLEIDREDINYIKKTFTNTD